MAARCPVHPQPLKQPNSIDPEPQTRCPVRPQPLKNKASLFFTFFIKRNSWLKGLFERSYNMKTGRVKLPGLELFVVSELSLVKQVMVDEVEKFPKSKLLHEMMLPLLGESIFTTNGDQWRKQRDMLSPAFVHTRVTKVFELMQQAAGDMLSRLEEVEQGKHYDIDNEMTFVTADIIYRTIMTTKLNPERATIIAGAFTRFQSKSLRVAMLGIFKVPRLFTSPMERKRKILAAEIRSSLEEVIRPRYEAMQRGEKSEHIDILSSILVSKDPDTGKPFCYKEIVDQISMLFLAGHETSASSLAWAIYLLSEFPQIQEKAFQQIQEVVGDREIRSTDIKKLTFIAAIFRETLRLYPPVGFMAREAAEDVTMRDKFIKLGRTVIISPWLIHRNKNNWERPDEFDPERFLKEHKTPIKSKYLPFGMGPRVCIGAAFAMQEAVLILTSILKNYRIEAYPNMEPKPVGRLTIRSDNGINIRLYARTSS